MSKLPNALNRYVVCIGLPIATEDKLEKLKKIFAANVLKKYFNNTELPLENINIVVRDGKTTGIAFINCGTGQEGITAAREVVTYLDYSLLDKNTRLRFISCDDFDKFSKGMNKPEKIDITDCDLDGIHQNWFFNNDRFEEQIMYTANRLPSAAWFNPKEVFRQNWSMS